MAQERKEAEERVKNKLLDKIGDNIGDEEFVEYIHNDDTQILGGRMVPQY